MGARSKTQAKKCPAAKKHPSIARKKAQCPDCGRSWGVARRPAKWEDEKAVEVFLKWIEFGNSEARACRLAGWSPKTFISWKKWAETGIDTHGVKKTPPAKMLDLLDRYETAKHALHNQALQALQGELQNSERSRVPAIKLVLQRDPEWQPRHHHSVETPPEGAITIQDLRAARAEARKGGKRGSKGS